MNQVLQVFRKDVRRFWRWIAILWAELAVLVTMASVGNLVDADKWVVLPPLVVAMTAGLLIIATVHEEPNVGEREFWRTRPFHPAHLLGAKALFALLVAGVPISIAHLAMLHAEYPDLGIEPALVVDTLLQLGALIVPVLALGALTSANDRKFSIFMVLMICVWFLTVDAHSSFSNHVPWDWGPGRLKYGLIALIAAIALWRQYSNRRTSENGWIFLAYAPLMFVNVPWDTAWSIQQALDPGTLSQSAVTISVDESRGPAGPDLAYGMFPWDNLTSPANNGGQNCLMEPVSVSGLPARWLLQSVAFKTATDSQNGRHEDTGWMQNTGLLTSDESGYFWNICRSGESKLSKNELLRLRSSLFIAVFEPISTDSASFTPGKSQTPQVGPCRLRTGDLGPEFACPTARDPRTLVSLRIRPTDGSQMRELRYGPLNLGYVMFSYVARQAIGHHLEGIDKIDALLERTEYRLRGYLKREIALENIQFSNAEHH